MKNPEKNNVHDTFDGSVRYSAPVYQRYYVWGHDQLQVLLDDIESSEESSLQFIGATVVQDFGKKGGNRSPNEYLIIDGQQRLTTIYLLICGLAWIYLNSDMEDEALTLTQTYLSFSAGKYAGMPKLLPTIQDRKQLFDILEDEIDCIEWNFSNDPTDETSRRRGIADQWKNIIKYFDEAFYDSSHNLLLREIEKFQDNILNYIEYIQITLEPEDDANTAFSKLNFQGISLAISDLVRNDVFSRLSETTKESLERFYKKEWKPFEKAFPQKSFDQYITIFSFIKFEGKIPKSRAFPELQKSWCKKDPSSIIEEMSNYSDLYIALVDFSPIEGFDKEVNERVRRFSCMPKTTVTWPYLLQILHEFRSENVGKKQVLECLSIVESFLVRRAIVGLEPTGLHAVFKSLWNKAGANSQLLKDKIVTATIRCPSDEIIKETLVFENMYSRQITKYLLIQREIHFNKSNGYDNATDDFSAEHIMPKNHSGTWSNIFTKNEHKVLLNTIGNLIPLTRGQNSKAGDLDWDKKRILFKGSNWKITQKIGQKKKWTKQQIQTQTKAMSKWITEEWKAIN